MELTHQQREASGELSFLVQSKIKASENRPLTGKEKQYCEKLGISVMSGKGTGKDAWTSAAIIWFLCCFPFPKIGCTAPTGHQLKDVLWSEIAKWKDNPKSKIKEWLVWQSEKVYFKEQNGERWFAVARTTNTKASADEQAATLAGLHEDYMMFVVDEAQGVPQPVYREIEGAMTGKCNFALVVFNPSIVNSYAVQTHFKDRARWIALRWNAEQSELVAPSSIAWKLKKYGRDSSFYRWSVLGLPPQTDENLLIPNDWVMNAIDREVEPLDDDQMVFSLDVGAGGDDSALLKRRGPMVYPIETTSVTRSEELVGWALRRILDEEPRFVFIDIIGIGWGVAGNLRSRLPVGMEVVDVNVAELAAENDRFHRMRDELWWRTRDRFEEGSISIPDDPILIGDLTSIRKDESTGRLKVEGKKSLKARGVESPNRGDALIMTEYYPTDIVRRLGRKKNISHRKKEDSWKTI